MTYKEVIELGFKRREGNCQGYLDEHGYPWFWASIKLDKRHEILWEAENKNVYLNKYEKDGYTIMEKWDIKDIELLKNIIRMFSKSGLPPEPIKIDYSLYC